MIRTEVDTGWRLIGHADHARLAGEFARHWKNDRFEPPKPFAHILDAIVRHDDSWTERDANPKLTDEGLPSAFTRKLVGTYEAFEEIELEPYLAVREQATERAAKRDPYAAVLISMHTVNLLTEQADLSALGEAQQEIHEAFVDGQRARQSELRDALLERPTTSSYATEQHFQRGFEFLQACDNLSLLVCADYEESIDLRHEHPTVTGEDVSIQYRPLGEDRYTCEPWPFDETEFQVEVPYRQLSSSTFASEDELQTAFGNADRELLSISLIAP